MTKRTVDLTAPFGYGRKHAETITAKVPLKYLRDLASKAPTDEIKQYAKDILAILAPPKEQSEPAAKQPAARPTGKPDGPGARVVGDGVANPAGTYTLVYATRMVYNNPNRERVILGRGDAIKVTDEDYAARGELMRKFVKGALSPDRIAKLLETAKGGVPPWKGPAKTPVEAVDFKNSQPVKDQAASHPASTVNMPSHVGMETGDLKAFAENTPWATTDVSEMDRKPDIVAAIQADCDRANGVVEEPGDGPHGDLETL